MHQAESIGVNIGSMPSTRNARSGIRVRSRRHHADDPMTKNIRNSTGCNDTIICESLSDPSISVIFNADNIRRCFRRNHEGNWTGEQPGRGVAEDSHDGEGEGTVADAKKGSTPIRLVNEANSEG